MAPHNWNIIVLSSYLLNRSKFFIFRFKLHIVSGTGSAESIRKVIEKQISEIEELMAKNEEIHQENAQLKIQIEENRLKNAELLKIVQEIGESYNLIENTFRAQ